MKKEHCKIHANRAIGLLAISLISLSSCSKDSTEPTVDNLPNITGYPIVGTNQTTFYSNTGVISTPGINDAFLWPGCNIPR